MNAISLLSVDTKNYIIGLVGRSEETWAVGLLFELDDNIIKTLHLPYYFFSLFSLLFCSKIAIGHEVKISIANNFSTIVRKVNNNRETYSGTTVFLDSDLSLSEITEPINDFLGVFDGQGHIISDLKINSFLSRYTGLFGYSEGLTIRNVVIDSSCTITNSFGGSDIYIGGIIGYCEARNSHCNIENSVNMAEITFGGGIGNILYLGGIAGSLHSSSSYSIRVKNCANYGSVTHSGSSSWLRIGGLTGYLDGLSSIYAYFHNCLNYGKITTNNDIRDTLHLGGIIGYSQYAYIENCVSAGRISTQTAPPTNYVGSIVGLVDSYITINYCYSTSDLNEYASYNCDIPIKASSYVLSYDNTTFELNGTVSVGNYKGSSLIDALNIAADYYILRDYSRWLFNKEKKSVNFTINNRTSPITMKYRIILLPSLASEGNITFDGWYNDNECSYPLNSFEANENKMLHAKFEVNTNNYTITFDTRREGIYLQSQSTRFGAVVSLPSESIREHCSVGFWENAYGDYLGLSLVMPAHDLTLYAVWKCTHLATPEDFVDFSIFVNSGMDDYSGTTVYLDSDLSLSGKTLEPIGTYNNQFLGVFDGHGHVISNLKMNSSSDYTGLFGYSGGLTIKNVVLDSSCSITNSYSGPYGAYMGGFIGCCSSENGECNIENNVNMAVVTFNGTSSSEKYYILHLGGFAGILRLEGYFDVNIKNCANYGSISQLGEYIEDPYVGGIVGYLESYNSNRAYIYNCLNNGEITHDGENTAGEIYLGGIVGYSKYVNIENCVSTGKLSILKTGSYNNIGSIVGHIESDTHINHCHYTNDVKFNQLIGSGGPTNLTDTPKSKTDLKEVAKKANDYTIKKVDWNKWAYVANNAEVIIKINNIKKYSLSAKIILLPSFPSEENQSFYGWYDDPYYINKFQTTEIKESKTLYSLYGSIITVFFDKNEEDTVTPASKKAIHKGHYGELPENLTKTGHTFAGWFTEDSNKRVTPSTIVTASSDHTLYAQWSINNYTLTFVFDNGTENESIILEYNQKIIYPDTPKKDGYSFNGWDTDITAMPARNVTIAARWVVISSGNSSVSLVIGIVSPCVVAIIVILIVLFVLYKRKTNDIDERKLEFDEFSRGRRRVVMQQEVDNWSEGFTGVIQKSLSFIYSSSYVKPKMKDALIAARLTKEQADFVFTACNSVADSVANNGNLLGGLTKEDVAAIAMYTYDFGPGSYEKNPYRLINKNLIERNYAGLQKASGLLYLLMTALRKLPRVTGTTLYRGVRSEVRLDKDHYYEGNIITWTALSSTSPSMNTTKSFLEKGPRRGDSKGTLFIIENGWGYDIQPYSLFPDEEEILLEPEREFKVTGIIRAEGIIIINLQMQDTPLPLPDVFGSGIE